MRYKVEIQTNKKPKIVWINGGVGYTEQELKRVVRKIENDSRITGYRIIGMDGGMR